MKRQRLIFALLLLVNLLGCVSNENQDTAEEETDKSSREFYQLKTYTFDSEAQIATTDQYLKDAFIPALTSQGVGPIGVFKNRPNEQDSSFKTYVLIPFSSLDQFVAVETNLEKDDTHLSAGDTYLTASHDNPPYKRIESTLMQAFVDMPQMATPNLEGARSERIYELRSYESSTEKYYKNKVDMFNAGGEIKLFDRLGCNAVFYAEVLSGSAMPNLVYMTTYENMEARDQKWDEFFNSPEWEELKGMEKYKNNVSRADILLLYPTEYSDY